MFGSNRNFPYESSSADTLARFRPFRPGCPVTENHAAVYYLRSSQESVGATCPIIPLAKPFPGRFYPTETVPQFQLIQPFPSCPWAEGPSRLRNTHYGGDVQILTTASKWLARPLNSRIQPTDSCEDPSFNYRWAVADGSRAMDFNDKQQESDTRGSIPKD